MRNKITYRSFEPADKESFARLNSEWINKYFVMEPIDERVLGDPEAYIINHDGRILVAEHEDRVIGVVALRKVSENIYEFTKMAVDESHRGKGIGRELSQFAISEAKKLGAKEIILYSNTLLESAIALYRKIGFVSIPLDGPYKRSNIKMKLSLGTLG